MNVKSLGAADRHLLPEGRATGPMPWVLAIMMFLTVLAAAAGLGLGGAAQRLSVGDRVTIQIVQANAALREAEADAVVAALRGQSWIAEVRRVEDKDLRALLEPWLGTGGIEQDIAIPAMVEAKLTPDARIDTIQAAAIAVAPSARVDDNAKWLEPLGRLVRALRWLAAGLVLLTAAATAATVFLAARAALDTHRETIEVLHLMGATDRQVARLFQRRIALDALFGGMIGLGFAFVVLVLLGKRLSDLGSELVGSVALPLFNWLLLGALPIAGVFLAMLVARMTILRALGRLS